MEIEGNAKAFAIILKSCQKHKSVFCLKLQYIVAIVYYVLVES